MMISGTENNIQYSVLTDADFENAADLLAGVFSRSEPLDVATGITSGEVRQVVELNGRNAMAGGLMVAARDTGTNRIAGAVLAHDLADPVPEGFEPIAHRFAPILALLDDLGGPFLKSRTILPGEVLHIFMLAVDPQFAGRGIGRNLLQYTVENAREKGFTTAIAEATGKTSQKIFREQGFTETNRVEYGSFLFRGTHPFEPIRDQGAVLFMEKRLAG